MISTEILNEYAELLERYYSADFAERTLLALDNIETVVRVKPAYRFRLIEEDLGDNKLTDAAAVSNTDQTVTNAPHFDRLNIILFLKFGPHF